MGLVQQYDPPAYLPDFERIPGARAAWHQSIQGWIAAALQPGDGGAAGGVAAQAATGPALYDPSKLDPGPTIEQDIVWNAFPAELVHRLGRAAAMAGADRRWPLSAFKPGAGAGPGGAGFPNDAFCHPGTEYCEWHVDRQPGTRRMKRVTFTTESLEYWQALHGDLVDSAPGSGSPEVLLDLYRTLVNPSIELDDLIVHRAFNSPVYMLEAGQYNPYNCWNVTRGIAHVSAPPNLLQAEIMLAVPASAGYVDQSGRPEVRAEAIGQAMQLGESRRNSDMAIIGCVNALARQGRLLALASPLGVYIDHVDLAGWTVPGGIAAEDCVRVVRGGGRSMMRVVVEVPSDKFDLSDVTIGGTPLRYGGQIAECITVRLRALASVARDLASSRLPLVGWRPRNWPPRGVVFAPNEDLQRKMSDGVRLESREAP